MHARGELSLGGGSRYFRALLDSLLDAVVIADAQGLVWGYNRAAHRLFGHAPAEVFGRPIGLLIPSHCWYADTTLDEAPEANRRRIEGRRKDGTRYHCVLDVTGFVVDSQHYLVGVAREVGEPGPELDEPGVSAGQTASAGGIARQAFEDAV
jgi:two-component system, sensor histidine kinase